MQTKLVVNQPGDRFEEEADRMADFVMSGKAAAPITLSLGGASAIQREEKTLPPPKPNNYDDALKKILDALAETPAAKDLKAKAAELGKDFLSSVEGKVVAGSALGGALAAIIATNSELPMQLPELPLDFIAPGLKAKLTYEGPVQKPTNISLQLTSKSGVSFVGGYSNTPAGPGKPAEQKAGFSITIPFGGPSAKKPSGPTDSEKYRAETARIAADQAKISEAMKSPDEKKEDRAFWDSYWKSKINDPLNPTAPRKKEDLLLMRKESNKSFDPTAAPSSVHTTLSKNGSPLDSGTRALMESRFGHDFSQVRIHTDAEAAESARAVNAQAYTVGQHIAFASNRFDPNAYAGRHLLAHELAHTLQQSQAGLLGSKISKSAGPNERDADAAVSQVVYPASAAETNPATGLSLSSLPLGLQREPPPGGGSTPKPSLPVIDPSTIPKSWRVTPVPPSHGQDVFIHRGLERGAAKAAQSVIRPQDVAAGGFVSRDIAAAHDAVFNAYERHPVLSGPDAGGVLKVRIPSDVWDELVRTNSVSERSYGGFSTGMKTTEMRINSIEAANVINSQPVTIVPPDPYYDRRPGAVRPTQPRAPKADEAATPEPPTRTPRSKRPTAPLKPPAPEPKGAPQNQTVPKAPPKTPEPSPAVKPPTPEVTAPPPESVTPSGGVPSKAVTPARVGREAFRLRTAGRFLAEEAPGLLFQALLMALFPPEVHIHNENYEALNREKIAPALQRALAEQAAAFNKLVADDPAQSVWATVTVESDYRAEATSGGDLQIYLQDLRFLEMKITHEYLLVEGPKFQVDRGAKVSKKVTYSIPLFGPATGASDSIRKYRKMREGLTDSSYKVRLETMIVLYKMAEADSFLKKQLVRDLQGMLNDDEEMVQKAAAVFLRHLKTE